jgi:hypothetical protein
MLTFQKHCSWLVFSVTLKFTNIRQSIIKLKTHSGFHDLFRYKTGRSVHTSIIYRWIGLHVWNGFRGEVASAVTIILDFRSTQIINLVEMYPSIICWWIDGHHHRTHFNIYPSMWNIYMQTVSSQKTFDIVKSCMLFYQTCNFDVDLKSKKLSRDNYLRFQIDTNH